MRFDVAHAGRLRQSFRVTLGSSLSALVLTLMVFALAGCGVEPAAKEEALSSVRSKAERGVPALQLELGRRYYGGIGVPTNSVEALKWYRKAAEQNLAEAQFYLGQMYAIGDGVAKDLVEAEKWYRKAAEQGGTAGQFKLGQMYESGDGVARDLVEAVKWYRKAAEQGEAFGQFKLGWMYANGDGVAKDSVEAVKWWRKAADQGDRDAQVNLGYRFWNGDGVPKDFTEAAKWYRMAAEQGRADAQNLLGVAYDNGYGVSVDLVQAYKWFNLAAAQGNTLAVSNRSLVESRMTPRQITQAQRLTREIQPGKAVAVSSTTDGQPTDQDFGAPVASGSGFFITTDGWLVTNAHVVEDSSSVRVLVGHGMLTGKMIHRDKANDLALLKVEGTFAALPITASRAVKLGQTVATVGFPNVGLQGFSPKLARGEIASLAGAQDDPRHFQISVPVQPGNSGGPLVDARGNVVGVVVAKLSEQAARATSGVLAENVNYAVKSGFLLTFLESVPDISAKLKEPNARERPFEDTVAAVQKAAALVLVYR